MAQHLFTVDGETRAFPAGSSVADVFNMICPRRLPRPVAASVGGRVYPLEWKPEADATLIPIDYTHDEGRRVYERTLRFLFLLALRRVLPEARARVEHSVAYGLYVSVNAALTDEIVDEIAETMRALRDEDLPITRERWSRERAMAYFTAQGREDTVRLLSYRTYTYFEIYRCAEMCEYIYGDMLPSTGHVEVFALLHHTPGVVIQMPDPQNPAEVAKFIERPKMMRAFYDTQRWYEILGCANAADLNDLIAEGALVELVRVVDALQEKSIAAIADKIAAQGARAVFIAGPSSSGKTTFTNRLAVQLRVCGLRPVMLSLDNYYLEKDDVPLDANGEPDLECLEALDLPLFGSQLRALLKGETIEVPRYSFGTKRRKPVGEMLQISADQPVLIEGIHGLNPKLCGTLPPELVYRIYISALTTINLDDHNRIRTTDVRLLRRMVRDRQFRNAPFEETLSMWRSVRRGEERYIFPYQEEADVMFNSALAYELPVLKKYAYSGLAEIGEESPYATVARRLRRFLDYFTSADVESELAPTAILREFIGGCSFYLKAK